MLIQNKKSLVKYYYQQKIVISVGQDLEPACRINISSNHA